MFLTKARVKVPRSLKQNRQTTPTPHFKECATTARRSALRCRFCRASHPTADVQTLFLTAVTLWPSSSHYCFDDVPPLPAAWSIDELEKVLSPQSRIRLAV